MCDPRDLRASLDVYAREGDGDDARRAPALYLYESVPGGVGLAAEVHRRHPELLARTLRLVASCPCPDGCPACVSPGPEVGPLSRKAFSLALLNALVPS
jgi:DEAD/DEAH box helicase domain-containing protein